MKTMVLRLRGATQVGDQCRFVISQPAFTAHQLTVVQLKRR
jgi:hypothetical protein